MLPTHTHRQTHSQHAELLTRVRYSDTVHACRPVLAHTRGGGCGDASPRYGRPSTAVATASSPLASPSEMRSRDHRPASVIGVILTGQTRFLRFGWVWFNMASVDIINFENKYDYPDNYELQQHRRSSVAIEWYKTCITTASSTVLLRYYYRATRHKFGAVPVWRWFFCFTFTFTFNL